MKKEILFLVIFVVAWKSTEAKFNSRTVWYPEGGGNENCSLVEVKHKEEFDDKMKAISEYTALKIDKHNSELQVYEEWRFEVYPGSIEKK